MEGLHPIFLLLLLAMSVYEITHEKDASFHIGPSIIFSWYLISPSSRYSGNWKLDVVGIHTPQKLILSKLDLVTETGDGHRPSLSHRT